MASTIIIKNGAGGSTPSSLKQGELAINVDSGSLFYGTSGSSNSVSSSFFFQHVTASGEVSASKVIADTISGGVGQNGLTLIGNVTASGIIDASPSKIVLGDKDANIAGRVIQLDQTQTAALQFNMQTGAHIVASTDRFEITDTPGNLSAQLDVKGEITASGEVSSSSTGSFRALNITDDGVAKFNVDTNGHVSASGDISSSATLLGTDIELKSAGVHKASIDTSGNADFEGNLDVNGTTNLDDVDIDGNVDLDGNLTMGENSSGHTLSVFGNSTGVNMTFNVSNNDMLKLGDNTILGVGAGNSAGTSDLEVVHNGTDTIMNNKTGRLVVTSSNAFDIQASDTSFSGDVSGSGTGSFVSLNIKDQGVLKASIDANGVVTGSVFHGTQHILHSGTIYINDDPLVQNSLYMGNSVGNQDSNWNDPQAAGGTLGSTSTVSISEDDTRWGMILPFDVSKVEIQCSIRPGGACSGDNFFVGLYTAARPNNSADANYNITLVAHNDSTFQQGKYTTNDFTHTANLDKGSLIFVGIGSEDATAAKNAPGILNVIITQR